MSHPVFMDSEDAVALLLCYQSVLCWLQQSNLQPGALFLWVHQLGLFRPFQEYINISGIYQYSRAIYQFDFFTVSLHGYCELFCKAETGVKKGKQINWFKLTNLSIQLLQKIFNNSRYAHLDQSNIWPLTWAWNKMGKTNEYLDF